MSGLRALSIVPILFVSIAAVILFPSRHIILPVPQSRPSKFISIGPTYSPCHKAPGIEVLDATGSWPFVRYVYTILVPDLDPVVAQQSPKSITHTDRDASPQSADSLCRQGWFVLSLTSGERRSAGYVPKIPLHILSKRHAKYEVDLQHEVDLKQAQCPFDAAVQPPHVVLSAATLNFCVVFRGVSFYHPRLCQRSERARDVVLRLWASSARAVAVVKLIHPFS